MPHPNADLAREFRANLTPAERRLWYWLRKRPLGFKFRRQVQLGPYIVDFACYEGRLVVEVDGQFHAFQAQDLVREEWLRSDNWEVARYWNRDVRLALDVVLADIEARLALRMRPRSASTRSRSGAPD